MTKVLTIADKTAEALRKADRAVQSLAGVSRSQTVGLFDAQCVWVNGELCAAPWRRLMVGDTVEVRYDPARRYSPRKKPPQPLGFSILFEDAHLIVVDKPAGWLTVPSPHRESNTLIQRISDYLTLDNRGRRTRVHAVQRLDRGVSGVLVFAKTIEAFNHLRRQFEAHQPEREYLALVAGTPEPREGVFHSFLATSKSLKRYSTGDRSAGERAVTHYRTLQRLRDATLVAVRLETGRRNQIRVHFAEAGHPVLGDERYEHQAAKHPRWPHRRLALHAASLACDHPATGERLRWEVPLPQEFQRFLTMP
jgi:23S rRNA pseudouridine1911/1915/1917 synthase